MHLKFNLLDTRAGQDILHIGKSLGIAEGETRGIVKGEDKRNREIINLMLLSNVSLETMCQFTGLSKEKVIALKSEIEKQP